MGKRGCGMPEDQSNMMMEMKSDIAHIKAILSTMANTNNVALEALQSAKSAHHRLDRVEKTVYWAGTTVIGAVIVGAVTFFMK